MAVLPLVRGLVPSSWITCAVTEGSKDLLTVPTMELASTTVYTLTMLVSDVKVSSYIKDHNRCIYAYESVCVHTHTHTHTHTGDATNNGQKGEKGEPGIQGEKGHIGPQGPPGPQGMHWRR